MDNKISTRIKELRISYNLTQTEFSESINTTQAALSGYERGDRAPSLETLICIAQKYNISLDWLCGLSDTKKLTPLPETYTDLIKLLVLIDTSPEIDKKTGKKIYESSLGYETYSTFLLEINDKHIMEFYEEWKDISSIRRKSPSGDKLYNIWLKDIYERYNFPLENAAQSNIDDELPFN